MDMRAPSTVYNWPGGISELRSNSDICDYRPFNTYWLDSCLQETLLPAAPWHKLIETLSDGFTQRIEKVLDKPERRQMIFELLGPPYVERYFPQYEYDHSVLEAPQMHPASRQHLETEALSFLQGQMTKAAKESGVYFSSGELTEESIIDQMNPTLKDFISDTSKKINTGLDRHLLLREKNAWQDAQNEFADLPPKPHSANTDTSWTLDNNMNIVDRQRTVEGRARGFSVDSTLRVNTCQRLDRHASEKAKLPIAPNSWGPESDNIGLSVCALIQRNPRHLSTVCSRLRGKQLPSTLRSFIWLDCLQKHDRKNVGGFSGNAEKVIREKFGRALSRGVIDLKLERPTKTPIRGLIENAVIEMYDSIPGMQAYNTNTHLKEASRTLNILYTYNRSYDPYLIHWLFPLQLTLTSSTQEDEQPYNLCMYLDMLGRNCFPKWPEVFAMAENVMRRLRNSDEHLHDQLQDIALKNIEFVDSKDFLVQLISIEKEKAKALTTATPGSDKSIKMSKELLANPLIFLRKWIGEGFVSVLDSAAVLFAWDQCFLTEWLPQTLEDICLSVLMLLKDYFMKCTDYHEMKKVFLFQPCKLYTADIQKAFQHLQRDGSPSDIPDMNHYQPITKKTPTPTPPPATQQKPPSVVPPQRTPTPPKVPRTTPTPRRSRTPTPRKPTLTPVKQHPGEVDPFTLKKIKLKFVVKSKPSNEKQDSLLGSLDVNKVKISAMVFHGNVRLRSTHCRNVPEIVEQSVSNNGDKVFHVEYKDERVQFTDIDPSSFNDINPDKDSVFIIVRASYGSQSSADSPLSPSVVVLGYCKIPMTLHTESIQTTSAYESKRVVWRPSYGADEYPLIPGNVPSYTSSMVSRPFTDRDHLQEGSLVYITIVQPDNDVLSPSPTQPVRQPRDFSLSPKLKFWTPYSIHTKDTVPHGTPNTHSFDIYVDQLRFLPDNATIIKVTGRVIKPGIQGIPDIAAYPVITSNARSPTFLYKLPVIIDRESEQVVDAASVVLLRAYTIDVNNRDLLIVGTTILSLFNIDDTGIALLNVGGFQLRMKYGMPDTKVPLGSSSFQNSTTSPGFSVLVRILPHTEDMIEGPDYNSGYYLSDECNPTETEQRVLTTYDKNTTFPGTVREAADNLRYTEAKIEAALPPPVPSTSPPPTDEGAASDGNHGDGPGSDTGPRSDGGRSPTEGSGSKPTQQPEDGAKESAAPTATTGAENSNVELNDEQLTDYIVDRLDRRHLIPNTPPGFIDLTYTVNYSIAAGLNLTFNGAYGLLSNGLYCNVLAKINPGYTSLEIEPTSEGWGKEYKYLTGKHDYTSIQTAPRWTDDPWVIHPFYDYNTCAILQLFGMDAEYTQDPDFHVAGKVTGRDGKDLELNAESQLGWTCLPLFNQGCVNQGEHILPVFEGQPSGEFINSVLTVPVDQAMSDAIQNKTDKIHKLHATLKVNIWDGHFLEEDRLPLKRNEVLLEIDRPERFRKTMGISQGRKLNELVLVTMSKKHQKKGVTSEKYRKAERFFQQAMSEMFTGLIESALMNAGYGPL